MLVTEEQAAVTQCGGPEGCGYFNEDPRPARWCVGSRCMSWRWAERPFEFRATGTTDYDEEAPRPDGDGWEKSSVQQRHDGLPGFTQNWRRKKPGRLGFCGPAGQPGYPE